MDVGRWICCLFNQRRTLQKQIQGRSTKQKWCLPETTASSSQEISCFSEDTEHGQGLQILEKYCSSQIQLWQLHTSRKTPIIRKWSITKVPGKICYGSNLFLFSLTSARAIDRSKSWTNGFDSGCCRALRPISSTSFSSPTYINSMKGIISRIYGKIISLYTLHLQICRANNKCIR